MNKAQSTEHRAQSTKRNHKAQSTTNNQQTAKSKEHHASSIIIYESNHSSSDWDYFVPVLTIVDNVLVWSMQQQQMSTVRFRCNPHDDDHEMKMK